MLFWLWFFLSSKKGLNVLFLLHIMEIAECRKQENFDRDKFNFTQLKKTLTKLKHV